jgi:hypothetical protein
VPNKTAGVWLFGRLFRKTERVILKLLAVIDRLGQHAGPTPPFQVFGLPDKPAR